MKYQVTISEVASAELRELIINLNEFKEGLGDRLLKEFEESLETLERFPELWQASFKNFRMLVLKKSKVNVIYVFEYEAIEILAVYHSKRNPHYWRSRI